MPWVCRWDRQWVSVGSFRRQASVGLREGWWRSILKGIFYLFIYSIHHSDLIRVTNGIMGEGLCIRAQKLTNDLTREGNAPSSPASLSVLKSRHWIKWLSRNLKMNKIIFSFFVSFFLSSLPPSFSFFLPSFFWTYNIEENRHLTWKF